MTDPEEITELVDALLAEFPDLERNPHFLERSAEEIQAGRDPEIPKEHRSKVVAELRRRALILRN